MTELNENCSTTQPNSSTFAFFFPTSVKRIFVGVSSSSKIKKSEKKKTDLVANNENLLYSMRFVDHQNELI